MIDEEHFALHSIPFTLMCYNDDDERQKKKRQPSQTL